MDLPKKILSQIIVHMKYAKYLPELKRRETWEELVTRNKQMHLKKYPKLAEEIEAAYKYVYEKKVLPSMRSMQFAGKPIQLNPIRMYNCCFVPVNCPDAFWEIMFLLLSGTGVGYSVQTHHVEQLPEITKPRKTKRHLVGDSIEGWSDAVKVLIKAYFSGRAAPEFDFSDIRPKGARLVTSGGKAPGAEPLKDCLHNIRKVLDRKETGDQLTSVEVHDICCYMADAVLAGGIRRAAMISLFNFDDEEMLTCKFGKWYETDPQRARANNSAVILRHKIKKDDFLALWKKIEASGSGEPGFFFTNDKEVGTNPCGEVSLRPTGLCNLSTVNVTDVETQEELNVRVKAAAFIGTLQAGFTNFHYLREAWKRMAEKEALIGVSMTGIASSKVLQLDLTAASKVVVKENERVAKLIGINKAARCTVCKPEGTSSLVVGSSSGIHAWHDKRYIRRMRVGKNESIYQYLLVNHPELVEDEFFKPHIQAVISVPIEAPLGAITRSETAIEFLGRITRVYKDWIIPGHRKGPNHNNVSATISIKPEEWEEVGNWMWEHRDEYTALSVLPFTDHSYVQAPFESITKKQYDELTKRLHEIDLSQIVEEEDGTILAENLACSAGSCEIV